MEITLIFISCNHNNKQSYITQCFGISIWKFYVKEETQGIRSFLTPRGKNNADYAFEISRPAAIMMNSDQKKQTA